MWNHEEMILSVIKAYMMVEKGIKFLLTGVVD
jgi:hypothetical protein